MKSVLDKYLEECTRLYEDALSEESRFKEIIVYVQGEST